MTIAALEMRVEIDKNFSQLFMYRNQNKLSFLHFCSFLHFWSFRHDRRVRIRNCSDKINVNIATRK